MKILEIAYAKSDFYQVANNSTQLNAEEKTLWLRPLKDSEDLFDGNLWDWDTETIDLELKTGYKHFNSKYYPVHIINKETFHKDLKRLVGIGVLTLVQYSQYGTPIFIIKSYCEFNNRLSQA